MSWPAPVEAVLALAFRHVPGGEANAEIAQVRRELGQGDEPAVSYELVLPDNAPATFLAEKALPRLVYFLDCRGLKLPAPTGVFVSMFAGDRLYFFHVEPLLRQLGLLAQVSHEQMLQRWGEHSGG